MSVVRSAKVKDSDCKRGKVTQRPPISYVQFKYPKWISEPDSIKVKLTGGDQYTCDLMNNASNTDTYLKWFQVYERVLGEKNLRVPLDATTMERKKLLEDMKKFLKVSKKETPENKVVRELEVAATNLKLAEASAVHVTTIEACYDLFCQLLADDPQVQWDRIVREVHNNDPWIALDGTKIRGLQMKTSKLLQV
jgi:hypothetical protein